MNADSEQTADALDRAADHLLLHGWRQGAYGQNEESAPKCLLGTVNYVVMGDVYGWGPLELEDLRVHVLTALAERACVTFIEDEDAVATWNDQVAETVDDVIELCRSTAKQLREETQT